VSLRSSVSASRAARAFSYEHQEMSDRYEEKQWGERHLGGEDSVAARVVNPLNERRDMVRAKVAINNEIITQVSNIIQESKRYRKTSAVDMSSVPCKWRASGRSSP